MKFLFSFKNGSTLYVVIEMLEAFNITLMNISTAKTTLIFFSFSQSGS